jgi:hypothetical protein
MTSSSFSPTLSMMLDFVTRSESRYVVRSRWRAGSQRSFGPVFVLDYG